jgi:hypothetical protein
MNPVSLYLRLEFLRSFLYSSLIIIIIIIIIIICK